MCYARFLCPCNFNFLPCKEQSKMKYSRVVQLQVTSCYISDAGSKQNQALNN